MNLVDAVKLLPGDRIDWAGNVRETDKWNVEYSGAVVKVTPAGGILIADDRGFEHWIGYHCVRRFERVRRRSIRGKPEHNLSSVLVILQRACVAAGYPSEAGRAVGLGILERFASVSNYRDLLPQDYDPVYRACERALQDKPSPAAMAPWRPDAWRAAVYQRKLREDLGDLY
jgi:hypothetical protein